MRIWPTPLQGHHSLDQKLQSNLIKANILLDYNSTKIRSDVGTTRFIGLQSIPSYNGIFKVIRNETLVFLGRPAIVSIICVLFEWQSGTETGPNLAFSCGACEDLSVWWNVAWPSWGSAESDTSAHLAASRRPQTGSRGEGRQKRGNKI